MSLPVSDQDARKQALEELKTLSKDEQQEIYRILKRNNAEVSENSNGVFFDLVALSTETFQQITKFLEFCRTQRKNEEERSLEINVLRKEQSGTKPA